MPTTYDFIQKNLKKVRIALKHAREKPGVTAEELERLTEKLNYWLLIQEDYNT